MIGASKDSSALPSAAPLLFERERGAMGLPYGSRRASAAPASTNATDHLVIHIVPSGTVSCNCIFPDALYTLACAIDVDIL